VIETLAPAAKKRSSQARPAGLRAAAKAR